MNWHPTKITIPDSVTPVMQYTVEKLPKTAIILDFTTKNNFVVVSF